MKIVLTFCLILVFFPLFAQNKHTETESQLWLGYIAQARLSEKWGLWFDIHHRRKDHIIEHPFQQLGRVGLIYQLTPQIRLFAGYVYFLNDPQGSQTRYSDEHRPWEQIQWTQDFPKLRLVQSLRLEQRFREKVVKDQSLGYFFNHRIRYNLSFFIPLTQKRFAPQSWFLLLASDTHLNFGQNIVYNYFDQHRSLLSLGYQVSNSLQIQCGYMNIFQQLPAGNEFKDIHILRLFVLHNFDWRKEKKKP